MKKLLGILIIFAMVFCVTACGDSTDDVSKNYEYTKEDGKIIITEYCADEENVVIPEKIKDLPVTEIGAFAFLGSNIKSVTIPDTVLVIGEKAFMECGNLIEINFGANVEQIDNMAFSKCTSLKELTVPKSVTRWGNSVFSDNTSLVSLTFEEGVTTIAPAAFYGASSLESVTIPASVKTFSTFAFGGCSNLKDAYIKSTDFETLGNSLFGINENLVVHIPKNGSSTDFSRYKIAYE